MQDDSVMKIKCVAFSPSEDFFAFGGSGGSVKIYDMRMGKNPLFM